MEQSYKDVSIDYNFIDYSLIRLLDDDWWIYSVGTHAVTCCLQCHSVCRS